MKRTRGLHPAGDEHDVGGRPRRKRNFKGLQLPLLLDPLSALPASSAPDRLIKARCTPSPEAAGAEDEDEANHLGAAGAGTVIDRHEGPSRSRTYPNSMSVPEKAPRRRVDLSGDDFEAFNAVGSHASGLGGPLLYSDLEFLADLGIGSSGTVALVRHRPSGKIMARKCLVMDAKPAVRKQALLELKVLQHCRAPEIIGCYGSLLRAPYICLVIEFMHPGSLDRILHPPLAWSYPLPPDIYPLPRKADRTGSASNPLPPAACARVIRSALKGMIYLYDQHRIIHRDIKPSNVLLSWEGNVKLCDFGVSKELTDSVADTFVGTSTYMSPERIQGHMYTITSDVWSLGLTLLEAALGRMPFQASAADDDDTDEGAAERLDQQTNTNSALSLHGSGTHLPLLRPRPNEKEPSGCGSHRRLGTKAKTKPLPTPIWTPAPGAILPPAQQGDEAAFLHSPTVGTPVGAVSGFRPPLFPSGGTSTATSQASSRGGTSDSEEAPWGILDLLQRIVHEAAPRLPRRFPQTMRDFTQLCLVKDPRARPGPHTLLIHPFLELGDTFDLAAWLREVVG